MKNLTNVSFQDSDLGPLPITRTEIVKVSYSGCTGVNGLKFTKSDLKEVSIDSCPVSSVEFHKCEGFQVRVLTCDVDSFVIEESNISGASFGGTQKDLGKIVLKKSSLPRFKLHYAKGFMLDISDVEMFQGSLGQMIFEVARIQGFYFQGKMQTITLNSGVIQDLTLKFTLMENCTFKDMVIKDSKLTATMKGVLFQGITFQKVDFLEADLTEATFVDCKADAATKWPAGQVPEGVMVGA